MRRCACGHAEEEHLSSDERECLHESDRAAIFCACKQFRPVPQEPMTPTPKPPAKKKSDKNRKHTRNGGRTK